MGHKDKRTMGKITPFNTSSISSIIKEQEGNKLIHLFGDYIFQNEITILFADSNQGKSILAMDIATCIAGGACYWPKQMREIVAPVLYFDFEMNDGQFAQRYAGHADKFPPILERASIDPKDFCVGEDLLDKFIMEVVKSQARSDPPKVVVIDNITYILESVSLKLAQRLMKRLKKIKEEFNLTFIILAHSTKRKIDKPITENDLGGSKMLYNFCDSAIAIGPSIQGSEFKYLKHLKSRSAAKKDEVATLEIESTPYLHFCFIEWSSEETHLKEAAYNSSIPPELEPELLDLREQGKSIRDIASALDLSKSTVGRYCKQYGI